MQLLQLSLSEFHLRLSSQKRVSYKLWARKGWWNIVYLGTETKETTFVACKFPPSVSYVPSMLCLEVKIQAIISHPLRAHGLQLTSLEGQPLLN